MSTPLQLRDELEIFVPPARAELAPGVTLEDLQDLTTAAAHDPGTQRLIAGWVGGNARQVARWADGLRAEIDKHLVGETRKVHVVTTAASRYNNAGWGSNDVLQVGNYRHGLGGWGRGDLARVEHGGPLVPGPHAYAYGLAVVISAHPQHDSRLTHVAELGDLVIADGVAYELKRDPRSHAAGSSRPTSRYYGEHVVLVPLLKS